MRRPPNRAAFVRTRPVGPLVSFILPRMWRFLRRQATYFVWGFAIALVAIVAYDVGVSDLVKYVITAAIVGLVVSVGLFFLERQFPESKGTTGKDSTFVE